MARIDTVADHTWNDLRGHPQDEQTRDMILDENTVRKGM
jgi:hypothetical protein